NLAQRIKTLEHGFKVVARQRQKRKRKTAQPHGGGADARTRLIAQLRGAKLVHSDLPLDGQGALHQALCIHLTRQIGDAERLLRHAQRDAEREGGLPAADIAAQENQVAAAKAATEELVERPESRWYGVAVY